MIYDTLNPVIFDFIEENKSEDLIILDVGCRTGKFGNAIETKRKCFICGIELDEDAAKIAKRIMMKFI